MLWVVWGTVISSGVVGLKLVFQVALTSDRVILGLEQGRAGSILSRSHLGLKVSWNSLPGTPLFFTHSIRNSHGILKFTAKPPHPHDDFKHTSRKGHVRTWLQIIHQPAKMQASSQQNTNVPALWSRIEAWEISVSCLIPSLCGLIISSPLTGLIYVHPSSPASL